MSLEEERTPCKTLAVFVRHRNHVNAGLSQEPYAERMQVVYKFAHNGSKSGPKKGP
jgi:hypothetical protein